MDTLSLILIIFEGMIFAAVVAAGVLVLRRLSSVFSLIPKWLKVVYSILFGVFLVTYFAIKLIVDSLIPLIFKNIKELKFTLSIVKIAVYSQCNTIKTTASAEVYKTKSFVRKNILDRGRPKICKQKINLMSSQSFFKLSPVILQWDFLAFYAKYNVACAYMRVWPKIRKKSGDINYVKS